MPDSMKIKQIFGLLKKHGQTDNRHDIVYALTNKRTTSLKELTDYETDLLIFNLGGSISAPKVQKPADDTANKMRRKVISLMREMWAVDEDGRADMQFIYKFVKVKFKRHLNSLNAAELGKVITVLETKWLPWFYKQRQVNNTYTIKQISLQEVEK